MPDSNELKSIDSIEKVNTAICQYVRYRPPLLKEFALKLRELREALEVRCLPPHTKPPPALDLALARQGGASHLGQSHLVRADRPLPWPRLPPCGGRATTSS